jgi:outer membrane protein TolC
MKRWATCLSIVASAGATALSVAAPARAEPPARRLTLDECVAIAVQRNPDAVSSTWDVEGARSALAGTRGEYGPKLHVDALVQQWNSPFDIAFAIPGSPGPAPAIRAREAFTWNASVSLIQPVTPLFVIYEKYKMDDLGVDIAEVRRDTTRRDVAFRVAEAYYRLLEASRLTEVATTSVTQLEAQQRQAQSLLDNGVIGKNDVLRAGLALASARQRLIQTRGQVAIARGRLATLMGLASDTAIDGVPFTGEPSPIDEPSPESAEAKAAAQRLEVREVDRRIDQTEHGVTIAHERLFPAVSLVGSYMHVEGSAFQQKDSAYAGLAASWDVWDWGTTTSGIGAADARRGQAHVARSKIVEEVRLEARQAFVNAATAKEALAVARAALAQAEENYRIVSKKFEASTATTFDVVDAEALLTQARAQIEAATYDYLIAQTALQRATGAAAPRVR